MNERDARLRPYLEAIPEIIKYQIVTKALLSVWLFLLGRLNRLLLNSAGRVAVTSGDFMFLFTTWQGILMIVITVFSLFVYVGVDLNSKIILSDNLLRGKEQPLLTTVSQAVRSLRSMISIQGIGVCFYIALIAPLVGVGLSISLTASFYIPTFITSVIASTPLYLILTTAAALLFASAGAANLFILHGAVIDHLPLKEAGEQSRKLMRENWKDYLRQNVFFILVMTAVLASAVLLVLVLPLFLTDILPLANGIKRFLTIFFVLLGVLLSLGTEMIGVTIYIMKMTQLYHLYRDGENLEYRERPIHTHSYDKYGVLAALILLIGFTVYLDRNFESLFPLDSRVRIIAHRAGGAEGAENTIAGLDAAVNLGAYGSEIDIQRTKDGYYILNHDDSFSRVAGDKRKPSEMTLANIRDLSVDGEPIPTYEEMLEASRGRIILFTELKGETADRQMADDAVRIIREYGMQDEVVLISLKYELIDYIETAYPEMQTGFLTFAAFGETEKLNCDFLALEEESADNGSIRTVHNQGKKVLIWTVNKKDAQRHFFCSGADAVITDNVAQANQVKQELHNRSDLRRMADRIRELIS